MNGPNGLGWMNPIMGQLQSVGKTQDENDRFEDSLVKNSECNYSTQRTNYFSTTCIPIHLIADVKPVVPSSLLYQNPPTPTAASISSAYEASVSSNGNKPPQSGSSSIDALRVSPEILEPEVEQEAGATEPLSNAVRESEPNCEPEGSDEPPDPKNEDGDFEPEKERLVDCPYCAKDNPEKILPSQRMCNECKKRLKDLIDK